MEMCKCDEYTSGNEKKIPTKHSQKINRVSNLNNQPHKIFRYFTGKYCRIE